MSLLALLGVVFSAAAMIIVLSGFSGLKNYSLEFLSYASPNLEISSKKGKRFVFNEKMKDILFNSNVNYVKGISERAVMSINGGKKLFLLKLWMKVFQREILTLFYMLGPGPKKGKRLLLVGGLPMILVSV